MDRISVELPTVDELSEIATANNPNRLAFADDNGASMTWETFEEQSLIAADAFAEYIRQGDRVAILSESTVDTTVLWNGSLKAGATVSYVHTQASAETIRHSVDELRPTVFVVQEKFAEFVSDRVWDNLAADPIVVIIGNATREYEQSYDSFVSNAEPVAPDITPSPDDIAAIVWTSGTTGKPKGWCHTHRSLVLKGMVGDVERTTTGLTTASTSFMAWYGHIIPLMLVGGSVVYLPDWSPERWAEMVEEYGATRAGMVPTMWRAVLDLDLEEYNFSSLNEISFVGEKMDRTTLQRLHEEVCSTIYNHYASTELMISRISVEEMDGDRLESVGKPFNGNRVRIIEPDGDPDDVLPRGETGEIIVKGADCPVWVWGQSDQAAAEFTNGWWYSGDMGYRDEDGYLYLKGRKDFMIKSKGVKVSPTPIEERLNNHSDITEAAVVGIEDEEFGQKVTAVVHPADPSLDEEQLDEWCLASDNIAKFERPREYVFIDSPLPRTPTQKIDRKTMIENVAD